MKEILVISYAVAIIMIIVLVYEVLDDTWKGGRK